MEVIPIALSTVDNDAGAVCTPNKSQLESSTKLIVNTRIGLKCLMY